VLLCFLDDFLGPMKQIDNTDACNVATAKVVNTSPVVTQNATDFLDLVFVEISAAGTFI
jgi:hypothetical protein